MKSVVEGMYPGLVHETAYKSTNAEVGFGKVQLRWLLAVNIDKTKCETRVSNEITKITTQPTLRNGVLLEKLIVDQLVNKCSAFYETLKE